MNFIKKLTSGDIPLVYTFWVYGIALNILIRIMVLVLDSLELSTLLFVWSVLAFGVIGVILSIHWMFSVFRAVGKYTGSHFVKTLASVAVIICVSITVLIIILVFGMNLIEWFFAFHR